MESHTECRFDLIDAIIKEIESDRIESDSSYVLVRTSSDTEFVCTQEELFNAFYNIIRVAVSDLVLTEKGTDASPQIRRYNSLMMRQYGLMMQIVNSFAKEAEEYSLTWFLENVIENNTEIQKYCRKEKFAPISKNVTNRFREILEIVENGSDRINIVDNP